MREIKFRIWNDTLKVMYTPEMDKEIKNLWSIPELKGGIMRVRKDEILMQYTGLKDENGQEIYEGDIIQNESLKEKGKSWIVELDRGCFGAKGLALRALKGMVVIGNIYENPELLNF